MESENSISLVKKLSLVLVVLLVIAYCVIKRILRNADTSEPITKKLMQFMLHDNQSGSPKGHEDYSTIEKGDGKVPSNESLKNSANSQGTLFQIYESENTDKINKVFRFAVDYCRASPNITYESNGILHIGWRANQKFNFSVSYEYITYTGDKIKCDGIMTVMPINTSLLNFEEDYMRDSFGKLISYFTCSSRYFINYLHFDILPSQKLMVKIAQFKEDGSLRDLIYKSNPLDKYSNKYIKGKPLPRSLISLYGRQILEAIAFLHKNNWYHLHIHTGNILLDENGSCVKLSDIENCVNDFGIRNEHCFYYAYECFNNEYYIKLINSSGNNHTSNSSSVLAEVLKGTPNVFEKLDVIAFGRVLYEMTVGRELKAPCPDDMEYKEMDWEVAEALQMIFYKQKFRGKSTNAVLNLPEVGVLDLMKMRLFSTQCNNEVIVDKYDSISNVDSKSMCEFDKFAPIKEILFNPNKFLKVKLKHLNNLSKLSKGKNSYSESV